MTTCLQILESRLDNVVYRAGFARTRRQARQLVSHGHFLVNGQKVDIPSYRVSPHDVIDLREKSRELLPLVIARETHAERDVPGWMDALPEPDADPDPPAPDPPADRHRRLRAADRRALQQVGKTRRRRIRHRFRAIK